MKSHPPWFFPGSATRQRLQVSLILLVAVAVLAAVAVPEAFAQPGFTPGLQRAIVAQERHTPSLFAIPGVVGTAVGLGAGGGPVVKVFTESRTVTGIPRALDGVPVVVELTGRIYASHHRPGHGGGGAVEPEIDRTARFDRPVPIGVSTGHPDITAGTIGARVRGAGGLVYALSNNHIYANTNAGSIGDSVLQPGPFDGGVDPGDAIGTLSDFEPILFGGGSDNVMDAAVAVSSIGQLGNATPSDGYGTPRAETAAAFVNQKVQKYGRTTGLTAGRVDAINAIVNVWYGAFGPIARFVNQIVIRPGTFSAGGDSGSLVVAQGGGDNGKPVGLLFAGSTSITIANPIGPVLERFGVVVDGN
jgi:hypothetical protein